MNLVKLQIVVLIEKYKKVTDVAAEMGLKQPTVSFHMKSLESELGASLFQYRSGRVLLTDAGRALYQYAHRIVSLTLEAERTVKQFTSLASGNLELTASNIPGSYLVPKLLARFTGLHSGIDVFLSMLPDDAIRERLRSREIQLAVLHSAEGQDDSFQTQVIAADEAVLTFAPDHPFAVLPELTVEAVAREPWVQHEAASFLRGIADKWTQLNNVRVWNHAVVGSPEAVKCMLSEGGMIGVFSKAGIAEEVATGRLASAPLPGIRPADGSFVLAWRKDYTLSPLQRAFAEVCAAAAY
ncbi:LysR family transcriptional regulator [Paenibacillus sp. MMS20-IR301]|uniref:LysR family transcriptional regulator n=1 Tax=Paenibacillus sp. MMS20-IR301 TaxID=2895946 RepID=UPI0028EEBD35|nr:LysR family transcriptional regulator [Paenibacillus sp. MMS20-IR301]WNS45091.1 LysR family transcriptional regulator [Paenibacillus sp. MMS20-IR301]